MPAIAQAQIDRLTWAVAELHSDVVLDPGDARAVQAIARLWARFGYQDGPPALLQILFRAIEMGYAAAVEDLRDGEFDEDIQLWRPQLFDGG